MSTKTPDFTAVMKDMMGGFAMDTKAFEEGFKSQAAIAEKLSNVAIDAARKSTDLSAKWTHETLAKMVEVSSAKSEVTDYSKAMTEFASTQAEAASEHMAAFAEIAKKVQADTMELVMQAGKDMSEDMAEAAKEAGEKMQDAAAKVTSTARKAAAAK